MEIKKIYIQPTEVIYNALLDMMELQKGRETYNDPAKGELHFIISMYNLTWNIHFTATRIGWKRCGVRLAIDEVGGCGDERDSLYDMIRREYALLDSMLLIGTPLGLSYDKVCETTW